MSIEKIRIIVRGVRGLAGPPGMTVPQSVTAAVSPMPSDSIVAVFSPTPVLSDSTVVLLTAPTANTSAAPQFSHDNGLSFKPIVKNDNAALVAGDIAGSSSRLMLAYSVALASWVLLNPKTL